MKLVSVVKGYWLFIRKKKTTQKNKTKQNKKKKQKQQQQKPTKGPKALRENFGILINQVEELYGEIKKKQKQKK